MNGRLMILLSDFDGNPPASDEAIELLHEYFDKYRKIIPVDFCEVLEATDGAEGLVNGQGFLRLWGAAKILQSNRDCQVDEFAPGLIIFGSNGGGEAYAFDTRHGGEMPVGRIPFIGMELEYAVKEASTFMGFLEKLAQLDN